MIFKMGWRKVSGTYGVVVAWMLFFIFELVLL